MKNTMIFAGEPGKTVKEWPATCGAAAEGLAGLRRG
jgi:hypothetical protein